MYQSVIPFPGKTGQAGKPGTSEAAQVFLAFFLASLPASFLVFRGQQNA
jgi:hypothetical protein